MIINNFEKRGIISELWSFHGTDSEDCGLGFVTPSTSPHVVTNQKPQSTWNNSLWLEFVSEDWANPSDLHSTQTPILSPNLKYTAKLIQYTTIYKKYVLFSPTQSYVPRYIWHFYIVFVSLRVLHVQLTLLLSFPTVLKKPCKNLKFWIS
jgi:hypothetical protein